MGQNGIEPMADKFFENRRLGNIIIQTDFNLFEKNILEEICYIGHNQICYHG